MGVARGCGSIPGQDLTQILPPCWMLCCPEGCASGIGRRCWGRAGLWPREVPSSLDVCPPPPPPPTPTLGGRAKKCAGGAGWWEQGGKETREPLLHAPGEPLCCFSPCAYSEIIHLGVVLPSAATRTVFPEDGDLVQHSFVTLQDLVNSISVY